jgi:septal ring factor EnvC (AmiA/AmiB activator)
MFAPWSNYAQTKQNKKELENKKSKLKKEINAINELLKETKTNKKLSMNQVAILNTKLKVREELIQTINNEIYFMEQQILLNQQEIDQKKNNLIQLKEQYARMVYYAYRNKDAYNKLMFIFSSTDFNQAYQRMKYIEQFNELRKKQALEIEKAKKDIESKQLELKQKKSEKTELLTGEEQEKNNLASEKKEQEDVLAQLQDKEKQLKKQLEQKKKDSDALTATIKKLIQEEIRKQQEAEKAKLLAAKEKEIKREKSKESRKEEAKKREGTSSSAPVFELTKEAELVSADFASNKGRLPWPVSKGVITDGFGQHEHPNIKGFIVDNKGIDISTTKGAVCRALFNGEVTGVVNVPGSGKVVIIRHGEYLSVYTNLEAVQVKTGDKINSKQNIGNVAFNDEENKTEMNLQIWKGQKILNPEEWIYR